ncbi:MAG: DUF3301 domain-containing protein [Thiolinea sp.]
MANILLLIALGLVVWFWIDTLRTRERAVFAAARACKELGAQLLDQTVSLESIKPMRSRQGRLMFRRIYGFDFSVAGYERRRGRAFMAGQALEQVQIDAEQGTTIDMKEDGGEAEQ